MAGRAKKTSKTAPKKTVRKSTVTKENENALMTDMPVVSNPPKTNKKTIYVLALLVIGLGLLYYFKDLFVIATVNGRPISRMAVVEELEKQNGKSTVENLITKELILQEARKNNVTVSKEDIDNELKKIEDDLSKQGQTLDQVLQMQGLTKEDVEENLKVKLYIERLLADKVNVSDEDAQKYFEENKAMYPKDAKFEDQKDSVKETLKQQKLQEQFQTWLEELKANAKINYFKTY